MISLEALISLFQRARRNAGELGVRELLDAARLAEDRAMTADAETLRRHLRLLWCRSFKEEADFDALWAEMPIEQPERAPVESPAAPSEARPVEPAPPSAPRAASEIPTSASNWSALPVHAPRCASEDAPGDELRSSQPVSRRQMLHGWRRLRRMRSDGALTVFDLSATIERVARQGVFTNFAYRRQQRNHARLLLMIDQNGSMTPMHRFSRDLAATAARHAESAQIGVDIVYFHNIPNQYLYRDPHLTEPVSRDDACARCARDTGILIVSDAGAARGFRHLPRLQETINALVFLRQYTALIAWLNPMPQARWAGSTAQMLAALVPMHPLNREGFSRALDVARGQRF